MFVVLNLHGGGLCVTTAWELGGVRWYLLPPFERREMVLGLHALAADAEIWRRSWPGCRGAMACGCALA
ncbi:hypothetical protein [Allokutzneria albata]|uniref:Uncharacterized protein n=1 Tax=Allokutzneria albata TaxID=211114 RepID=A0A1G9TNB1_ALLAB|nr:hypothetical protein [Allokutzneria albata]SDM49173.1 hypothetical protein SAMN04489726_1895 [Allokutzneria albata]